MRLKRRFLFMVALWALSLTSWLPAKAQALPAPDTGPLGETPAQIVRRYGPVLRHNARVRHHQVLEGGTEIDGDLHQRGDIIVRVVYQSGTAVLLEFNRVAGPLSPVDVEKILGSTSGGFAWEMVKTSTEATKIYDRSDKRAVGHWVTDADGSLLIAAEDFGGFGHKLLP